MKINKTNHTKTMLTICMGFLVLFLITQIQWMLTVSLIIGLIGMFSEYLSQKIVWLWSQLTILLGLIVPNILMAVIFYLILFPIAILSRIFGQKDMLKLKRGNSSYYKSSSKQFTKETFTNPW